MRTNGLRPVTYPTGSPGVPPRYGSVDQVAAQGKHDGVCPIGRAELRDQRLDRLLHRVLGQDHGPGHLFVGVALGHVAKELELAWRERVMRGLPSGRAVASVIPIRARRLGPSGRLATHARELAAPTVLAAARHLDGPRDGDRLF